jgi:cation:H+ antiporter
MGFVFLVLLAAYMWQSIRWARAAPGEIHLEAHEGDVEASLPFILGKLVAAVVLVVLSAKVLIPAVAEAATRLHVPESIIAATLVAFGTSLPELITAVTASLRGHGDLAVGNVVGADILNVLFVAGAAAAVTPAGLVADDHFFRVLFPLMLLILVVFRLGIIFSADYLRRGFGFVLLGVYGFYLVVSLMSHE